MTDHQKLKQQLSKTPYLVASPEGVRLVSEKDALRLLVESSPDRAILNARNSLDGFADLNGVGRQDREFTRKDIANILGVTPMTAWWHVDQGILKPSVRNRSGQGVGRDMLFAWRDGFVAGLVGSLKRLGFRGEILRQVDGLFPPTTQKKRRVKRKRTARKQPLAKRS